MHTGIQFLPITDSRFTAFATNRLGGVSTAPYGAFNLGDHVGDAPSNVRLNRQQLAAALSLSPADLVFMEQVHGNRLAVIDKPLSAKPVCDAMVTNLRNVVLMVLTADCVPIVFIDKRKSVVGVAHAGWKGTALNVAAKTVGAMQQQFGSAPNDIEAWMGPCIKQCCYGVGAEVVETISAAVLQIDECAKRINGQWMLDLHNANRQQLVGAGIEEGNLHILGECTSCNTKMYYSHRAEKGTTGRLGMGVLIR